MATKINAYAEAKTPQMKAFTDNYTPRQAHVDYYRSFTPG